MSILTCCYVILSCFINIFIQKDTLFYVTFERNAYLKQCSNTWSLVSGFHINTNTMSYCLFQLKWSAFLHALYTRLIVGQLNDNFYYHKTYKSLSAFKTDNLSAFMRTFISFLLNAWYWRQLRITQELYFLLSRRIVVCDVLILI